MSAFVDTVASLIPDWPKMETKARAIIAARCATLVVRQVSLAPVHIRFGLWTLFVAYRVYALLRVGFSPAPSARASALAAFSELPLPMVFGLERALRSAALLFYFEQPEVLSTLGEQTVTVRQAVFRAKRTSAYVAALCAPGEETITPQAAFPAQRIS
jgi:hypothetical protein